jgi:hypothetical protein
MQPDDAARLDRLESQVSYLLQHLGISGDVAAVPGGSASDLFATPASGYAAMPMTGPAGSIPAATIPPELIADIQSGKLIQAIKKYRQLTGLGLKESKDVIDAMARDLGVLRRRGRR